MKKFITTLACAGALSASVVAAPSASADTRCAFATNGYTLVVQCPTSAPGTEFRIVVSCPEGQRGSLWESQTRSITMQCNDIRFIDSQFR